MFLLLTSHLPLFIQVLLGGGRNHRMGLFDMVMVKDNHISIAGGVTKALKCVDLYLEQNNLQMEVEVFLFFVPVYVDCKPLLADIRRVGNPT